MTVPYSGKPHGGWSVLAWVVANFTLVAWLNDWRLVFAYAVMFGYFCLSVAVVYALRSDRPRNRTSAGQEER